MDVTKDIRICKLLKFYNESINCPLDVNYMPELIEDKRDYGISLSCDLLDIGYYSYDLFAYDITYHIIIVRTLDGVFVNRYYVDRMNGRYVRINPY